MEDKELIKQMYHFTIELALKVPRKDFNKIRDKWNTLMQECEKKI